MSTIIEIRCDFCKDEITNKSINPDHMGYCLYTTDKGEVHWTNNAENNIGGPHICNTCINQISEAYNEGAFKNF